MRKNEFMTPSWENYNPKESDEIKALRKIIFHLIREVQVLREVQIQSSILNNAMPKNSLYGKLYREVCIESYNSCGPSSGEEKILRDWFYRSGEIPDEIIMLKKLGYSELEISEYLKKINDVSSYT